MKFAIIGTSKIAHQLTDAFLSCDDMFLEAVYSRKQESGEAFAKLFGQPKIYTKLEEMLQNADIDLIYIASPNSLHYEHIIAALQAGKHVICEKPIILNADQFQKICSCAEQHHCFLFEAITTLHMPNYHILEKKIAELDTIHLVTCNLSQYSSRYEKLKQGIRTNVFDPAMGGGAFYDLGVYCFHFVIGLFGKPHTYYIDTLTYNHIDTSGTVILSYPNMQAVITYGKDSYGKPGVFIQSEIGYIEAEGPCSRLKTVTWNHDKISEHIGVPTEAKHHRYEVRDFLKIIKDMDHIEEHRLWEKSLLVYQVMDAIRDGRGQL